MPGVQLSSFQFSLTNVYYKMRTRSWTFAVEIRKIPSSQEHFAEKRENYGSPLIDIDLDIDGLELFAENVGVFCKVGGSHVRESKSLAYRK